MTFFVRHVVVAATVALAGLSTAQAQAVASSQLDLSQLQVEVISLVTGEPTVLPSISLFSTLDPSGSDPVTGGLQSLLWRGTAQTASFMDRIPVTSALWPTEDLVHLSPDGVSQTSIGPSAISMSATLTEQTVQSILPGYGTDADQRFVSLVSLGENAEFYGGSLGNADAWQVTLAPKSQLTMSGVSNVSLNMDLERASRLLSPLADSESTPSLVLVAGLYLNARILDPVDGVSAYNVDMPGAEVQYFFDTDRTFQWIGVNTSPVVQTQNNFGLTLRNELDVEKTFLVDMLAYNETILFRSGRPEVIDGGEVLSPIPEPSTYALMGLGLVGLSVVTRQRRGGQAH